MVTTPSARAAYSAAGSNVPAAGVDRTGVLGVDGAERALWLHEKALRGQFADLKPEPGETVQVAKGAERTAATKRGKVLEIDREKERVRVEGLRLVKRHLKRDAQNPEGGIVEKPGTIALANVQIVCPKCDTPARVGIRVEGDTKKRFCKKCDVVID